jgi:large subunit ribosomal protein L4
MLQKLAPVKHTLVVAVAVDRNLKLASRNLGSVQVEPADSVNVYELLRFDKIVATKGALAKLQERAQP